MVLQKGVLQDYSHYCHPGIHWSSDWYPVSDEVSLYVVTFTPFIPVTTPAIVMISGLASVIDGFREVLIELSRDFVIYFVDTREKASSRLSGKVRFTVETFGTDITTLVKMLNLQDGKFLLFGYSLGATVIVDCYRNLPEKPSCMVLLEPNATFNYPKFSVAIMRLNLPFLYLLKPLVKWYIRQFRINRKEDYEMYKISARSLDNAHPVRLRKTALGISDYRIWDKLALLDRPVLIVGSSKDRFHSHEETKRMVEEIWNCKYIDLENNKRSHSAELGIVIREYLGG